MSHQMKVAYSPIPLVGGAEIVSRLLYSNRYIFVNGVNCYRFAPYFIFTYLTRLEKEFVFSNAINGFKYFTKRGGKK